MTELSERQTKILKAVVEEYINSAEPVGSETLEKKYSLNVSPATIRNEMGRLTEIGYLSQPHTSAGRIPSSMAIKLYIKELMDEKELSVTDEVKAKEQIWDYRFEFDRLMRETTKALAGRTGAIAIAETEEGDIYSAGYSNILDMPEFFDIDVTRSVLELLEETKRLESFFGKTYIDEPVHILIGDDFGTEFLRPCGLVFTHFESGRKKGALGVIGSCRLNYPLVIPMLKYYSGLVSDMTKDWK